LILFTNDWLGRLGFCSSQVIGWKEWLQSDLECVKWGVKACCVSRMMRIVSGEGFD